MHHRAKDITGLRVGYLTAIRYIGAENKRRSVWEIRCDCGKTITMCPSEYQKLGKRGVKASCGCMRRKTIGEKQTRHGMSKHPAFAVWRSMIDRCRLPTHQSWENYGGRGITVCERWQECFENFWEDMGSGYQKGLCLERKDNSKGYSTENCGWRTYRRQGNNKRNTVFLDTPSGRMSVAQAARRYKMGRSTLAWRLEKGWPLLKALTTPPCGTYSTQARATDS